MDASITCGSFVPAGVIFDFGGDTPPPGYLLCDGSIVQRVLYPRLFEVIGVTNGAGDGTTTFKLPDLQGRVTIGSGTGSGLTPRVLAAMGGEESHILTESEMPSHTHVQNSHNHTQNAHGHALLGSPYAAPDSGSLGDGGTKGVMGDSNGGASFSNYTNAPSSGSPFVQPSTPTNNAATALNQNTGGSYAHNNMQPFYVTRKIIKY